MLYRRWPTRADLLKAAVEHHGAGQDTTAPGDDLLTALRRSNAQHSDFLVLMSASLGGYYEETGLSPREVREFLLGRHRLAIEDILEHAVERGEADPECLTPLVRAVPYNLYRHEVMMSSRAVPDETLEAIVDDVFLPLVTPRDR